jgi:hypothetical protein
VNVAGNTGKEKYKMPMKNSLASYSEKLQEFQYRLKQASRTRDKQAISDFLGISLRSLYYYLSPAFGAKPMESTLDKTLPILREMTGKEPKT